MDDHSIIALFFDRDEQAITETAQKYGKLCMRIAKNVLRSTEDAEECVNDTYLSTWNSIPPQKPLSLMAFVAKIARHTALDRFDYLTAAKRDRQMVTSLSELEDILPHAHYDPALTDEDLGKVIGEFLQREKPQARDVFLRKYWYFDSISDICEKYGFSESKVKSLLFHTRIRLKNHLAKEGIYL